MKIVALLFIILFCIGVTFYSSVAHWTLREALLQVVLTVSTLGGSVHERDMTSPVIQWFQIFYISTILIIVLWGVSLLIEAMVRGEFVYYWGARRMEQRIGQLKNHYIICGFGRMGQEIARQLQRAQKAFVIVEHNPRQVPGLEASGYLFVQGDAREDESLLSAGIERARGLISVASTDEENVYITLSARVLNPKLYIVTRSSQMSGEAKLLRAGADRVISPYISGGRRMAQAVLTPSVVEFLDMVIQGEQMEMVLEEVTVHADSPVIGKALADGTDPEQKLGVHLLGIMTREKRMLMRALGQHVMREGDTLILLGENKSMQKAMKLLTTKGTFPTEPDDDVSR